MTQITRTTRRRAAAFALMAATTLAAVTVATQVPVRAQEQRAAPAPRPVVPLKLDVVLSRYQGDRKTGSLPFTLMVHANGMGQESRTSVRMGVDVPIPAKEGGTTYRSIGTNIDASATSTDDGRYKVSVSITDSSIASLGASPTGGMRADPSAFQTFSASNVLTLRDGQTMQFTSATDKVSGEVIKVDVTVATIK